MKLVPVLCLAIACTACCRDRVLTQNHLWSEKQFIAAIDQDPNRQDRWIKKNISTDTYLVMNRDGIYVKRK